MKTLWLRALVAVVVGAAAAAAMSYLPIYLVDRGQGAQATTLFRGSDVWTNARDEAFGLAWSNLQLREQQLLSPVNEGEVPAWAEPPSGPHPQGVILRIGTLASGWPFLSLWMRWTVTTTDQNFPVFAEVDDQDTSIYYAAEDFRKGNRAGGPGEVKVLWTGMLANAAVYALACWLLVGVRARLVTRREAAAPAP